MTAINDYPDDYIGCRGLDRHMWGKPKKEPSSTKLRKYPASRTVARLYWKCPVCGMEKRRILNRLTAESIATSYTPPEGYKLTGARKTAADVRKEYLKRMA